MGFPNGLSSIQKEKEDFTRKWKCLGCGYIGPRTRHYFPKAKNVPCAFFEYDERWWELVDRKEAIRYEKEKIIDLLKKLRNEANIFNFRRQIDIMIKERIERLREDEDE